MNLQETLQKFAQVAEIGHVLNVTENMQEGGSCEVVHVTATADGLLKLKRGASEQYWFSPVEWSEATIIEPSDFSEEVQEKFATALQKNIAEIEKMNSVEVVPEVVEEVEIGGVTLKI